MAETSLHTPDQPWHAALPSWHAQSLDIAVVRAALLQVGAVRVGGFVPTALLESAEQFALEQDHEEAWSLCPAGGEIVSRTDALVRRLFDSAVLDPFRYERSRCHLEDGAGHAKKSGVMHRDNWPVLVDFRPEHRFFHFRPTLLFSDVLSEEDGPTVVVPGTHVGHDPEQDRVVGTLDATPLPLLGSAGDLWLMASRVLHTRVLRPLPAHSAAPRWRRVVFMICKTKVPHP